MGWGGRQRKASKPPDWEWTEECQQQTGVSSRRSHVDENYKEQEAVAPGVD